MRTITTLAITAAFLSAPLSAQVAPSPPEAPTRAAFVPAEAEEVIRELATALDENFLFRDKGKAYANMLRSNLAAGAYRSFESADVFAETVTRDLQRVHEDRHLQLHAPRQGASGREEAHRGPPADANAISKAGWLDDGIAYLRFDGFPGNDLTIDSLRTFIDAHAGAKTLIIDARTHRGGGLAEMDVLFPHLFDRPTLLVAMETRSAIEERRGAPEQQTLRKVAAPAGLVRREHHAEPAQPARMAKAKVILLTSNATRSAAEHFSLSLQRTRRAILIGETTAGAGHFGGMAPLGHGYVAFIPVGRTYDPDTNQGWESTGVRPDVQMAADKALDEALRIAGSKLTAEAALASLK